MALVLTDADLAQVLGMPAAIRAVRGALRERVEGSSPRLVRTAIDVGAGRLVLTPGGYGGIQSAGLRAYTAGYPFESQLTLVWDTSRGLLDGLVVGSALGRLRTGAIGGVAFQVLAPKEVAKVAVIGAGPQARAQLEALLAVREPEWVEVYRRDGDGRVRAAQELREAFRIPVTPASSPETAVRGADVVITATTSGAPVVQADWLARGAHVTCVGPKARERTELDVEVARRANLIASDTPEQCRADPEFVLAGSDELERLQDLAELMTDDEPRAHNDLTLYLSHGLAGTEVAVATAALEAARQLGVGEPLPGTTEEGLPA